MRIATRRDLDAQTLEEVTGLIEEIARLEGHPPLGEHKYAQLVEGGGDWVGLLARDGERLVGYAHLRFNSLRHRPRAAVEVAVAPHGGEHVGLALLDGARAEVSAAGGGTLFLWLHRVADPRDTLGARAGFAIERELALMARDLPRPPAPAPLPDGVALREFRPGRDEQALLAVNNAAFEGHPEQGGWDLDELRRRQQWDWFDPDGLIMAWRGDEPLGFHWTKRHDGDPAAPAVGEVYVLGVHPRAHGSGLGGVLLTAGLRHLHERGCRKVILYVDCASAAAVRLYQSAGFEVVTKEVCYESVVAAVP